ncbi:MAG: hypothetical protein KDC34_00140 [Saprospiraceae bacterium]|nr:hypothetical protein [Saprospiraceae bacterium]
MSNPENSLFSKAHSPMLQAGIVFAAAFVFMVFGKMIHGLGIVEVGDRFPWMTAAAFMLFFALFNSIISLATKDLNHYWGQSILSFAGLAIANGLLAWLFSSISINEAGSYRWIYTVLIFGYLVFLTLMGMLKRIVEFAQREEWNHPRIRKRK